ncbi:hypothetical protein HDV00_006528 [Rhizophlyctis rosea]|nr:hypothetical protein HDV00_006528 [Rhizophlyctis rosea]
MSSTILPSSALTTEVATTPKRHRKRATADKDAEATPPVRQPRQRRRLAVAAAEDGGKAGDQTSAAASSTTADVTHDATATETNAGESSAGGEESPPPPTAPAQTASQSATQRKQDLAAIDAYRQTKRWTEDEMRALPIIWRVYGDGTTGGTKKVAEVFNEVFGRRPEQLYKKWWDMQRKKK